MLRCLLLLVLIVIATSTYAQYDTISINVKKGEMYALDYKMISITNTTLSGVKEWNSHKIFVEIEGGLIFTVKDTLANGYFIQAYYNHFAMKSETPKVTFSYNTQHTDSAGIGENELKFRAMFGAIINQPFFLTISKAGQILQIDGLDQLIEKITLEQHLDKPSSQSIVQVVGSGILGLSLMYLSNIYPVDDVVSSEISWINNLILTNKTKAHFVNKYTYTNSDSTISITGNGKLADYEEMMAMFSQAKNNELNSQFTATATLDKRTRWPIDVTMSERINMKVEAAEGTLITNDIIIDVYYKGKKIVL